MGYLYLREQSVSIRNLLNGWKYKRTKHIAYLLKHIYMTIILDSNRKIVLIDTSEMMDIDDSTNNANIYCIDEKDNIIWKVDSDKGIMDQDSFVYIEKTENGLYAKRFQGTEYMIEPETGKSVITGWTK